MKKIFGIALVLAVVTTLCFGTVALAGPDEQVNINWEIDGPGGLIVDTWVDNVYDHLDVSVNEGGSSDGGQMVTHDTYWIFDTITIDRGIGIFDKGTVNTYTSRGEGSTQYYANLIGASHKGGNTGLSQSFRQGTLLTTMDTNMSSDAEGRFKMYAGLWDDTGDTFSVNVTAIGANAGYLELHSTETQGFWIIPSFVWGDYGAFVRHTWPPDAHVGVYVDSSSWASIEGYVQSGKVSPIYEEYDYSGAGWFGAEASGQKSQLGGEFFGIK